MLHALALSLAPQTQAPRVNGCARLSAAGDAHCRTLSRWRAWRGAGRRGAALWRSLHRTAAPPLEPPPPSPQIPIEQARPQPVRESVSSIAQASASPFGQRGKLSFASETNSVLFHWLQQHRAGRPWSGTDFGGLVMLGAHIWLIWGILNSDLRVYFPIEGLDNGGSMIWNTIPSERATVKNSQLRISNFYITLWPRARIRIQVSQFCPFSQETGPMSAGAWILIQLCSSGGLSSCSRMVTKNLRFWGLPWQSRG